MSKILYHGTSADNLKSILKNGFSINCDKIWTPSENGIYFWSPDKLIEYKESDEDFADNDAIKRAFDSATCSLGKSKDCRAVIFEIEVSDEEYNDLCEDTSCPNMKGAIVSYSNINLKYIKKIYISDDLSLLRGYFISLMMERELNNLTFSDLELKIGKAFKNFEEGYEIVEEFYEGIEGYNLKEYNKRELFSILKI